MARAAGTEADKPTMRYSDPYGVRDSPRLSLAGQPEPRPGLAVLLTVPFIVCLVALARVPGVNYAVKAFGVILALAYAVRCLQERIRPSGEVWLYLAWLLWAGATGAVVATVPELFRTKLGTLLQIWVLLFIFSGYTNSKKTLSIHLGAFLVATAVICGQAYVTGDFAMASEGRDMGARVAGLVKNANVFGLVMLMGIGCLAYFWMRVDRRRWMRYVLFLPMGATFGVAIIASGSRKIFLATLLFFLLWVFFCYRKELLKRMSVFLGVTLLVFVGGGLLIGLAGRTVLGERLLKSWEAFRTGDEDVRGSGANRLEFYRVAFRLIRENPVAGVGLDNYRAHNPALGYKPAHTEYLEIAADTGLVGALVYLPWYVVLLRRTHRIRKHTADPDVYRTSGLILAVMYVIMVLNLGMWVYDSKIRWVILASFIGWTHTQWQRVQASTTAADDPAQQQALVPAM